ncbi:MAG: efflux RND transporter periplasmic adaptor subunit [Thermoanaerobaculia bacterium]
MKRSVKITIGAVVIVVLALVVVGMIRKKDAGAIKVTAAKVDRTDLTSKVSANGRIEAQKKVELSANVMGQIVNLAVREGEVVKKGDFLLQIDKAQLEASAAGAEASMRALFADREAARANLAEAQRNYDRAKKNYADRVIPLAELEKNKTAVDSAAANLDGITNRIAQARASLAGARDTLSKTTIVAPMSGIVTRLPIEEGEVAVIGTMNNPGTALLTISDMSVVEAVMEVDETDIPNVRIGQKANVTIDAYPGKIFTGTVTEVASSPIQNITSGSNTEAINFEVKIRLDHPPAGVRPGFSASADIVTGTRSKVLAIPIQSLVVRDKPTKGPKSPTAKPVEEEGVYALDQAAEKVAFVPVKTGITGDTLIEIESGLKQGQQIVSGPFRALRDLKDGSTVKLEKETKDKDKETK